jgi:hypothetical protein
VKAVSKILVEEHAENVTEVVCWNILKFKYTPLIHTNTHPNYICVPRHKRHKSEPKNNEEIPVIHHTVQKWGRSNFLSSSKAKSLI